VLKTIVETGRITKAANKLHRAPSNVTFRIQKLEQELAQTLFIREKNAYVCLLQEKNYLTMPNEYSVLRVRPRSNLGT
jgi:DNA-binding transcriptional LysR family regulator